MAFLGGLLSGMSTSTMGFITGAAEEAQRQLNPEPVEMTDAEKAALKFRYDTLGKQYDKLTEVKDGIVGFGKIRNLELIGPNEEILPYQKAQYEVSTTPGETTQEQIAKFIDYTNINDMAFAELEQDQQNKLRLYATNHGQYYDDLVNETNEGLPKDITLIPEWEKIIPGAPDWLINTLYANQSLHNSKYNKNVITSIPKSVYDKVAIADSIQDGIQLGSAIDYEAIANDSTRQRLDNNILAHHIFQYGAINKGEEQSIINRHVTDNEGFPEFFTANAILSETYLTADQHPAGQAFNVMPTVRQSAAINAYTKILPIVYTAAIDDPLGRHPLDAFHSNNIEVYTSMFREGDIVNKKYDPTGQFTVKGKMTKEQVVKDLNIEMSLYNKRGDAWNQYKGTNDLLMLELENPELAIGGRGYENIALGVDMLQNAPQAFQNIKNRIFEKDFTQVGGFAGLFKKILGKGETLMGPTISAGEKIWLEDHGYEGTDYSIDTINKALSIDMSSPEARSKVSQNNKLLASIARQRALTLELTYLAAAVVQGEGGKAISDGDQKQFLKALSYGWWSTPQQRVEAAQAIYESLSLYGEVALGYNNANTAAEMYGVREYERVAKPLDFINQTGKLLPYLTTEDTALISGDEISTDDSGKVKSVMVDDMYDGEAIGINIDNIVDFSVTLQKKFDDNKLTKEQIQALEAIPIDEEETFKFTRKEK
jgi:hypothetical protein